MKLLLDTHALLWFALNDPQLSASATSLIVDPSNEKLVSPASYWETTNHTNDTNGMIAVVRCSLLQDAPKAPGKCASGVHSPGRRAESYR